MIYYGINTLTIFSAYLHYYLHYDHSQKEILQALIGLNLRNVLNYIRKFIKDTSFLPASFQHGGGMEKRFVLIARYFDAIGS